MPDANGLPVAESKVDDQGRILPQYRDEILKAGFRLDPEGRPMTADGTYISPVAFGGKRPGDGSFFRTAPEFNQHTGEFETGTNWGNILSAGVGGVLAAGAVPAILGASGGASGAASGAGLGAVEGGAYGLPASAAAMVPGAAAAPAAGAAGASTMGIGSILGGVSKFAPLVDMAGGIFGGIGQGKRADQALQLQRDQLALQQFMAGLKAPDARMATATKASILKNAKPVKFDWGGPGSGMLASGAPGRMQFTGGKATEGLIDPRAKALSDSALDRALRDQLAGLQPGQSSTIAPTNSAVGSRLNDLAKKARAKVDIGFSADMLDQYR